MATALAETVSHYVPTFNKVELSHTIVHQKSTPQSPDGAGSDYNTNTLVLTQSTDLSQVPSDSVSNVSGSSTARSNKSDKMMQKKIEFEAGNTTKTHRVLRTLSKTLTRATSSKPLPAAPEQIKKSRVVQRTISHHEIKRSAEIKKSTTEIQKSGGIKRVDSKRSGELRKSSTNELRKSSTNLNGSNGVQQRKGSTASLRPSGLNKSLTPSDFNKSLESKNVSEIKKVAEVKRSSELRKSNTNLKRSNSSELKRSGNNAPPQRKPPVPSQLRNARVEPPNKIDALNAILNDFEMQKQRAQELSQIESDIYREEVAKYEAMLAKKKQESEAAITLAHNIKDREAKLERLFAELYKKEKEFQVTQEDLAAFEKTIVEELKKQQTELMETSGEKSSAIRMKEAQQRKSLKSAWANADATDPETIARKRMLEAQEEINEIQTRIADLKRELGRMKGVAAKGKSSDQRMRDERLAREENKKNGVVKSRPESTKARSAPREPEKRAHQSRLEEEKAKRAAKRRANADVAELIASQAGVSRSRFGSPYRAGMSKNGPASR